MSKINTQGFLKYYEQNVGAPPDVMKEALSLNRILDLDDFIQAPIQIWPDFAASLTAAEQQGLLAVWARLRAKPDPNAENPFLSPHDPSREHPVNPPTPGGPGLPSDFPRVRVAGRYLPLGTELINRGLFDYSGDQVFVKYTGDLIDASDWVVTGGKVRFRLYEGPNAWGPWTLMPGCDFSLQPGDPPHTGCRFNKLTWWALVVSAAVESTFTALPFAW